MKQFQSECDAIRLPFGCNIEWQFPKEASDRLKFDDKRDFGIMFGYHVQPNGRYSGDVWVGKIEDIIKNPHKVPFLHRVRGAKLANGKLRFPMFEAREKAIEDRLLTQAKLALPPAEPPKPRITDFEPVPVVPTLSPAEKVLRDRKSVGINAKSRTSSKPPDIWTEDWNTYSYEKRKRLAKEYLERQNSAAASSSSAANATEDAPTVVPKNEKVLENAALSRVVAGCAVRYPVCVW